MPTADIRAARLRGLAVLLALLLLLVSSELGLRGVLMYGTWASEQQLTEFNLAQLCTPGADASNHSDPSHPPEHGPLCFVHLLPVEELEPSQSRFANLQFVRLLPVVSALVQDVFIQSIAARAPPLA
ncbi:hypothetical protein [Meiothermus sp.]|uniref:hypothetical protein n=1 Tax=Meiothermus sp. TaxID=1955249 RepID=UPI0021DDA852|nr:hypothetical protein [Meiothermus sp.]GIW34966.1 MAG: hypothetical protein KatS3mg072_2299 [Meiothermus sp.]